MRKYNIGDIYIYKKYSEIDYIDELKILSISKTKNFINTDSLGWIHIDKLNNIAFEKIGACKYILLKSFLKRFLFGDKNELLK